MNKNTITVAIAISVSIIALISNNAFAQWTELGSGESGSLISCSTVDKRTAAETPYIARMNLSNYAVNVYAYTSGSWSGVGSTGVTGYPESMVVGSNGSIYVSYISFSNSDGYVIKYNGTSWSSLGAYSASGSGAASIALGQNDTVYVAYSDASSSSKLTVKKYNGSSWVTVGSAGFSTGTAVYPSLCIGSNYIPYVEFSEYAGSYGCSVVEYSGGSWSYVGSRQFHSIYNPYFGSIALNSSNTPYVFIQDAVSPYTTGQGTVMEYNGTSWDSVGNRGFTAGTAAYCNIAFNNADVPYVAYEDEGNSNKASVMYYNGSSWVTDGSAGFTSGAVTYVTMAFDSHNKLYVGGLNSSYYAIDMLNTNCTLATSTSVTNITCHGTSTGSAAVTASSGTTPYTYSWSSTATTSSISSVAAGTYYVTTTDANTCSILDTVTITQPASGGTITVSVSPTTSIECPSSSVSLTASGGSTYSWSPSTHLTASTGATVSANPTVATTYTVTGTTSGCSGTATAAISIGTSPTITATPSPSSICVGSTSSITGGGGNSGAYRWSPAASLSSTTANTVTASPTVTTTYSVTGTNALGCSGTGTTTVTVNTLPTVSATTPSAYCKGSSASITASGASTYTWSPSTNLTATTGATVTASPTVTTTYTVTGTNSSGCTGTATSVVTVNSLPTVSATTPSAYCKGSSASITASGASTYTWSPSTNLSATTGATVTASPTATTTYTVTGTNSNGCTGTATSVVTVNALPAVSATTPSAYCKGSSASITASNASTYAWSPSTNLSATTGTTVTASPTATTTYSVTGTDGNGCTGSTTSVVTVNTLPTVGATTPSACCKGSSASITASNASTYAWSPSTNLSATTGTTVTASPTATTTYSVTGTDGNGCTGSTTSVVTVNTLPTVGATTPSAYCKGSSASITASNASTYAWSPSTNLSATTGTTVTASPTTTTTYSVTGTDGNGCTGSATSVVTVNLLPTVSATTPSAYCKGSSASITASNASTYAWSPSTNLSATTGATITASPTATTTYSVTGTDGNGCTGSTTSVVTVNTLPAVSATTPSAYCKGSSTSITASNASTYAWSPSTNLSATTGTTVTASPTTTTTYSVTGTDVNGCTGSATSVVTVNTLPTVSVTTPAAYCKGSSASITASNASTYAWSPSTNLSATIGVTVTANPTTTTTYSVTGTDGNGCTGSATSVVTVHALPAVSATTPSAYCKGSSASITASNASTYAWSPSTNLSATTGATVTASPTATTTYSVTGTDGNGCTGSATSVVTVNLLPTVSATTPSAYCKGSSASITASNASTYAWSPVTNLTATTGATVTASPTTTTTYSVTGTDVNGCTGSTTSVVTVNPLPTVSATTPSAYCKGSSASITASNASTYAWSPSTNLSATTGTTVTASPTTTTTYSVTGTDVNGCTGTTTSVVTVNTLPAVSATTPSAYCKGSSASITASNASTYAWSPVTNLTATTGATVTASPTTTTTYSVTGTDVNGCTGSTTSVVTVHALPAVSATTPSAYCKGSSASITASNASTYAWSPSTNLSATTGATVIASPTTTTTYSVTGTDVNGCTGTTTSVVTVHALPAVSATTPSAYCKGSSASITASNASTYAWSPSTNLTATTGATVTASPTTTTTYSVTGTDGNGCTGTTTSVVTVNTLPAVSATTPAAYCKGSSASITASNTSTYAWSPSTNLTATTGATVTASPTTTTTYSVTGTDGNGCTGTTTSVVTVNTLPAVSATTPAAYCKGSSASITASNASTYAWSPATNLTATTGATVTASPTVTTTYSVTGTDVNGCTGTTTSVVTVHALPVVSATTPSAYCKGSSASITASNASTYAWSPSTNLSATTGATVIASPTTTTTYSVTGTDVNGCTGTTTSVVTVHALPAVSATTPSAYCKGSSASITASNASTYAWSPSTNLTATTGATVTASPTTTTTYSVTGTDGNGCTGTTTSVVTVNTLPAVSATAPAAYCKGSSASITASNASTYAWSPSTNLTATTGATVTASPTATTTYSVTGTDGNGCTGSTTSVVTVNALPTVSATTPSAYCKGSSASITASNASTYAWSPSTNLTATTGATVTASPTTTTTYSVTGTDGNGCTGSATSVVTVNLLPTVSATTPSAYCKGSSASITASNASTYAWSPSTNLSATTGATITASPTATTTYSVTGTDGNGCTGSTTSVVTVNTLPAVSATTPSAYCKGSSTSITASNASTYAWSPSTNLSATTGTTVTASPTTTTTYSVTGTDVNGCTGSATSVVTVNTLPTVSVTTPAAYCKGSSASITASNASTYAWSPSTNLSATIGVTVTANPTTTTTYSVTGTDGNGCTGSATSVVTVHALPAVSATTPSAYCKGSSASITASNASTYAWSPSANLSATTGVTVTASPTITTTYSVTGTDGNGCTGSTTSVVTINPLPSANAGSPQTICNGASATIGASNITGDTYIWNPSATLTSSTVSNPTANPTTSTTYTLTETITATGCTASNTTTVSVNSLPSNNAGSNQAICNGGSIAIGATLTSGHTYSWSPSEDLSSSTDANPTVNPTTTTTYTLTETITATGCSTSDTVVVTVNPIPDNNAGSDQTICNGGSIAIGASATTGDTYSWSPSTGLSTSTDANPTANPTTTTTYALTETITATGCSTSDTVVVTVNPIPANNAGPNRTICNGETITIGAAHVMGDTYNWSPDEDIDNPYASNPNVDPAGTSITYTLTETTTATGCSTANLVVITVNATPGDNAGLTKTICKGGSTAIGANSAGGHTYSWSPATGLSSSTAAKPTANPTTNTTYTLTETITATGCSESNSVKVIVNPLPTVSATTPSAYCKGSSASVTASGATNYAWSPSTNLSATTGTIVTASPTVTTTYSVTGTNSNGCTGSATSVVTVNPLPTVSATTPSAYCKGSSASITASNASTYAWSPSTNLSATTGVTVTASPTVTTTYSVTGTDGNGCTGSTTSVVTVNTLPAVSATTPSAYCKGSSASITASNASTYAWSPSTNLSATTGVTVTASPTVTTTYSVTGTDGNGCTGSTTSVVTVNTLPAVSATTPSAYCKGSSASITASNASTYAWSPSTNLSATTGVTVTASPTVTTTYSVTGTDGNGCTGSATSVVTVDTLPAVYATANDSEVCKGTSVTLSGHGAASYGWNNSVINNQSFVPTSTLTYTVLGTDGNGCTGSATLTIKVDSLPVVFATANDSEVCKGTSVILSGHGAASYGWNNNVINNQSFVPTSTLTYTVLGTDGNGCTGSASLTIKIDSLPVVYATANDSEVCKGTSVTLSGHGAASYGWNNSVPNNQSFVPNSTLTYTVLGTDGNGCTGSASLTIKVDSLPLVYATANDSEVCKGTSVTLSGHGATSYGWNNSVTNNQSFVPTSTLTYTVLGTNGNGCTGSATLTIKVDSLPVVYATANDSEVCKGTSVTLAGHGAASYGWNNSVNDNQSFVPTSTLTYTVLGTDGNGCTGSASLTIKVDSLPAVYATANDSEVCRGTSVTLSGHGATSYGWNNSVTNNQSFVPTSTLTYTVLGTDGNGCTGSASLTIKVDSLPVVFATANDSEVCRGTSVILSGHGAASYGWNNSVNDNQSFVPTSTLTYTVLGTDGNGCTGSASLTIKIDSLPVVYATANDSEVCRGTSVTLSGHGATSYGWNNSVTNNQSFVPTSTLTYTVLGTNGNGCTGSATLTIKVDSLPVVYATANDSEVCKGTSVTLAGHGAASYGWNNSVANNQSFVPNTTLTYTVLGTDGNGCTGSASLTIKVDSLPIVTANTTRGTVCLGTDITLAGSGATTYIWNNNVTDAVAFADSSTKTYQLIGTDGNGCTGADSITITVDSLPIVTANTTQGTVCLGTDITLSGSGASIYTWNNNITNGFTFTDSSTKTYQVIGTDGNGCTGMGSITVTVDSLPIVIAHTTQSVVCLGTDITLSGSDAVSYTWNNNVTNGVAFADSSTKTYQVIGTDGSGCTGADNITVTVNNLPIVTANTTQSVVCIGTDITLSGSGAVSYTWNNNVTDGITFADSSTKTYQVIGTDGNGCTGMGSITVTVDSLPIVIAHTTQSVVCLGTDITLSGSDAVSYTWNNNVTNGVAFADSSTKTYQVIGTDGSGCTGADNITVTVNNLPIVTANTTQSVVCIGTDITLSGSGAVSYTWNNNVTDGITFADSSTKTYQVIGTDGNGCTGSANLTVKVDSLPVVYATANDSEVCRGISVTLLGHGAASYGWNNNVTNNQSFVPTSTLTYTVLGTDGNGCTGSASLTIKVDSLPMVYATANDSEVCRGTSVTLSGHGATSYGWNNSVTNNQSFVPTSTLTYTVLGTDGNGCTGSASLTIKVDSLPVVYATANDSEVCKGTSVTLSGHGAASYGWNNSVTDNQSFVPTSTLTYAVLGTDGNGCTGSANLTIKVDSLPVVYATANDTIVCIGTSVVLSGHGAAFYTWNNNITDNVSFIPSETASYSVLGTDGSGCTGSNSINVTVDSLPVVSAHASKMVICYGDSVILTGDGAVTYVWDHNVINGAGFKPASTATYHVTGTNSNNCSSSDSITVIVNQLPNVVANATSNAVCNGGSVTVNGSGAMSYTWDNGITNGQPFVPTTTLTYQVTGTDSNGCVNMDSISVKVNTLPGVTANASSQGICQGGSTILTGSGATTYSWDNNVTNGISFVPPASRIYHVLGTDANGCTGSAEITITVNSLPVVKANTSASAVCKGSNVTLYGSGAKTYSWDNNVTNDVAFIPTLTRTYHVTGTDANGCTGASSTSIIINYLPVVKATASASPLCQGSDVTLTGSGAKTYTWNNNVINGVPFSPAGTKLYSVVGTDINGCTGSANISVFMYSSPVITSHASVTAVCPGGTVTLTATGAKTYAWDNGITNSIPFIPLETKEYTVTGTDLHGCTATANTTITVNSHPIVTANASNNIICKGDSITLTGGGAAKYVWNNNVKDGVPFTPAITQSYSVIATDGNGCTGAANVNIKVNALPVVVAHTSAASICFNGDITLTGSGAKTYTWNNNVINGEPFMPLTTNNYQVTGVDSNGCSNSSSISVAVNLLPTVTISSTDSVVCMGSGVTLYGNGASVYTWDNTVKNGTPFYPDSTAMYHVTGTDGNGCKNYDSISIKVNYVPATPVATSATSIGANSFTSNWDTSGNSTSYQLDIATDNGFTLMVPAYSNFNTGNVSSYNIGNMLASTTYFYRIRASNTCGASNNSNIIIVTTTSPNCNGITGGTVEPAYSVICNGATQQLTVSNATGGNLQWQVSENNVNWNDIGNATNNTLVTSPATQKEYYRCVIRSGACFDVASNAAIVDISSTPVITINKVTSDAVTLSWTPFAPGQYNISWFGGASGSENAVTSLPYTIQGINANDSLSITVTAASPKCDSIQSGQVTVHTLCAKPQITSLTSPIHAIKVQWTSVEGATSYRVYYRNISASGAWSFVDTAGNSKTIFTAVTGKTFAVYVAADNCPQKGIFGDGSDQQYVTTLPSSSCASTPTVTASSTCPGQITVNMSGGSGKYTIGLREISPVVNSGASYTISSPTVNITLPSSYANTIWEVFASSVCDGGAVSAASDVSIVTVKPVCNAINNVLVSNVTCNGFAVSWNPASCPGITVNNYQVLIKKNTDLNYATYAVDTNQNFEIVNWLTANVTYNVAVRALTCNTSYTALSLVDTISLSNCARNDADDKTSGSFETSDGSVTVYPNPASYNFIVDVGSKTIIDAAVKIEIVNELGQVVQTNISSMSHGHANRVVNVNENVAAGLYFIRTSVGATVYVNKLIIERN